jgi:4-amino-4-deoxy-L-arabinose transferase-like glycosyltransferase
VGRRNLVLPPVCIGLYRALRPPGALLAVLGAVFLCGLAWALSVPAFQAPDEPAHFDYTQRLAERFELPGAGRAGGSTEEGLAVDTTNAKRTAQVPETKPEWSAKVEERWRSRSRALPDSARSNGSGGPIRDNPPLYYLIEAGWYHLGDGLLVDRLFAMRLGSLLWLLVTVVGAWLLAGEVFRRDRTLQLVAAAVAGLFPMVTFVSSSVTPDAMLYALWTLALLLGARILTRGLVLRDALALGGVVALAMLTKRPSYALLPGVAFVIGVGLWRLRDRGRRRLAALAAGPALAVAVSVVGVIAVARALDRSPTKAIGAGPGDDLKFSGLANYLWQYYLPKLPFQEPIAQLPSLPVYDVWLKTGWAAFGWLEVRFPDPVYLLFAALVVLVAVAAGASLWRRRRSLDLSLLAFFALVALTLLASLHWRDYQEIVSQDQTLNQGRYLFPLIGLGGLAVAQALTLLPRRRRPVAAGAVAGALLVFQIWSLAITAARFYA